jgi:hypothetical protein
LISRFATGQLNGSTAQQLEILVRTAVFKSANEVVGFLFQQAANRIDATYQPKPGEVRKGRETIGAGLQKASAPLGQAAAQRQGAGLD